MKNAKLVVVGGDAKVAEVSLTLPTTIGRGRDVELTLPHPLVSRQHCKIFERSGRLFVQDLDSLNGTFLNNERLEGEAPLDPNQLLTLGNVTFRAVYESSLGGEGSVASQDTDHFADTNTSVDDGSETDKNLDAQMESVIRVDDVVKRAEPIKAAVNPIGASARNVGDIAKHLPR